MSDMSEDDSPLRASKVIRNTESSLERGRLILRRIENTMNSVNQEIDAVKKTNKNIKLLLDGSFNIESKQLNTSFQENIKDKSSQFNNFPQLNSNNKSYLKAHTEQSNTIGRDDNIQFLKTIDIDINKNTTHKQYNQQKNNIQKKHFINNNNKFNIHPEQQNQNKISFDNSILSPNPKYNVNINTNNNNYNSQNNNEALLQNKIKEKENLLLYSIKQIKKDDGSKNNHTNNKINQNNFNEDVYQNYNNHYLSKNYKDKSSETIQKTYQRQRQFKNSNRQREARSFIELSQFKLPSIHDKSYQMLSNINNFSNLDISAINLTDHQEHSPSQINKKQEQIIKSKSFLQKVPSKKRQVSWMFSGQSHNYNINSINNNNKLI